MRPLTPPLRTALSAPLGVVMLACATASSRPMASAPAATLPAQALGVPEWAPPPAPPARWMRIIGEYGRDSAVTIVLERDRRLWTHTASAETPLTERGDTVFDAGAGARLVFRWGADGRVAALEEGTTVLPWRAVGPASGNQLVITPMRPIEELRREALAARPPVERGPFLPSQLTELTSLDPTIKLEIRYATSNNLFGTPFYSQARAFLQRPAAEAVVRANASLRPLGYGLLVHDGYRPWYVTKMFWDASPEDKHIFVANPAEGSKHNRGAAVDLTLYELATGRPVEMVSTYDETSPRAYPDYPGGTSRQRWHRDLLRRAMEAQGFTVYEAEWWHFDFRTWRQYAIGNVVFEDIPRQ